MSIKVVVIQDGIKHDPVYLINGDEMYIHAGPPAIFRAGRWLALKMKIKSLEQVNQNLRKRIEATDVKSLEGATIDELLDELKLRSEYFV